MMMIFPALKNCQTGSTETASCMLSTRWHTSTGSKVPEGKYSIVYIFCTKFSSSRYWYYYL
eukprot:SAG11_NODE_12688_length_690_cov_1.646362_1_plen_60_part_01